MNREKKWFALSILNVLMNANGFLTTEQIINKVGCERKTVCRVMEILEVNGFGILIVRENRSNKYKYLGTYGL